MSRVQKNKQPRPTDQFDLSLRGHGPLRARNANQKLYLQALANSEMTFGIGPAGTGKTFLAASHFVERLLADEFDQLVLCRPAVTIENESHGFLPGNLNQKMEPFTAPVMEAFYKRVGKPTTIELLKAGKIRILPIGYARGLTMERSAVIVDEAQNLTEGQAKALVTRLGEGTRYAINGDLDQTDVGGGNGLSVLTRLVRRHEMPIPIIEFEEADIVRSAMCRTWVEAFRKEGL